MPAVPTVRSQLYDVASVQPFGPPQVALVHLPTVHTKVSVADLQVTVSESLHAPPTVGFPHDAADRRKRTAHRTGRISSLKTPGVYHADQTFTLAPQSNKPSLLR